MAITTTAAKNKKLEIYEAESAASNNVVLYTQKHVELESQPAKTESVVQVYQPGNLPNDRPIAASNLQGRKSNSLPNNRPIAASNLQVAEPNVLPDRRPVFASTLQVVESNLPSDRPIAASNLQVVASDSLPNNRPIGSNSLGEDADALMGYID